MQLHSVYFGIFQISCLSSIAKRFTLNGPKLTSVLVQKNYDSMNAPDVTFLRDVANILKEDSFISKILKV